MNCLFRAIVLLQLAAVLSLAADRTPEQEHLNRYVGEWDVTLTNLPGAKIRTNCDWILGGAYLRHFLGAQASPDAPLNSTLQLMTYDTAKQTYRAWSFYSNGSSEEGEGAWDAATNSFTWTYRDESKGITTRTKVSFPDADSQAILIQTKNREGDVVSEIRGTKTKRK